MNERIIWDLVSKARELAVSDTPDGGKCFDQDVFHNKFAELIVKECENSIKLVPTHYEAQDKIIVECLKAIRETFRS